MSTSPCAIHLDSYGILRVGKAEIALDQIVEAHRHGQDTKAILARFAGLTADELRDALNYHVAQGGEAPPRGPEQRDANWRKWNATLEDDLGTDTPPNEPIGGNGS